jgi:hypothetical protein
MCESKPYEKLLTLPPGDNPIAVKYYYSLNYQVQSAPHLRQVDYAKRWSGIQYSHLAYINKIRVSIGRQEITVMLRSFFYHSVRCKITRERRENWVLTAVFLKIQVSWDV